ncbi:hypothetical protein PUNSTDRAFT_122223 [Punctularia strigosozonata HHB-11173 SS5]|uniref:uncharacterized protein n=1 Tax=Punctularia strigosozonata (strain HHB-11173) TaxID=741275 RepID=UPI0004417EFD|nr:uncharacterized protein PUNSTDRAFT_122223 [Punctularia strigosozonata HHB-11173 SS5]EIN05800.1 hypothetical protein PUNSTDRAFT_122223 [Punctularia strigosozonata HHB-11173 SS5]
MTMERQPPEETARHPLLAQSPTQHEAFLQQLPRKKKCTGLGFLSPKAIKLTEPCIHDPGSGPRVRDVDMFLSSYWAAPASLDDELCAAFSAPEVLDMLQEMPGLGKELSSILYYNRSRRTSRICPACRRLFNVGDALKPHFEDDTSQQPGAMNACPPAPTAQLVAEQELSGLCSPVCFILAFLSSLPSPTLTLDHPLVQKGVRTTWGAIAEDMDDEIWDLLDSPHADTANNGEHEGLGLLLKMTRMHDLGLGQIWFPEEDFDEDADDARGSTSGLESSPLASSSSSSTVSGSSASASPTSDLSQMTGSASESSAHPWSLSPMPLESVWMTKRRHEDPDYSDDEMSTGSSMPYHDARSGTSEVEDGYWTSEDEDAEMSSEEDERGRSPYVKRIGTRTVESIERDSGRWAHMVTEDEDDESEEYWTSDDDEPRGRSREVKPIGNRVASQRSRPVGGAAAETRVK